MSENQFEIMEPDDPEFDTPSAEAPPDENDIQNGIWIETLDKYTQIVNDFAQSGYDLVLYRGQSNDDELLPGIGRKIDNVPPVIGENTETDMLKAFKKRLPNFLQGEIKNDWDYLAVCQHHGLATRLLDWTQNPLIALWFACSSPYVRDNYSVVWAFSTTTAMIFDSSDDSGPFEIEETKIISPNWVAKRIANQSGLFTIHKPQSVSNNLVFKNLAEDDTFEPLPIKFVIPQKVRKEFIRQLNVYGVNYSTVYPDLDGLCKSLNYQYLDR